MPTSNGVFTYAEEAILTQEDFLKLTRIMHHAYTGAKNGLENLTEKEQKFILSTDIIPELREEESDRLLIEIKFKVHHKTELFDIVIEKTRTFYVECLQEGIQQFVEKQFTETVKQFLQDVCHFLYETADKLHDVTGT